VIDDRVSILSEKDLARIIRRMIKEGMNSEEIKEYFVAAIPRVLRDVSEKQPKAGFKKS
jgi:hypothetical protein